MVEVDDNFIFEDHRRLVLESFSQLNFEELAIKNIADRDYDSILNYLCPRCHIKKLFLKSLSMKLPQINLVDFTDLKKFVIVKREVDFYDLVEMIEFFASDKTKSAEIRLESIYF